MTLKLGTTPDAKPFHRKIQATMTLVKNYPFLKPEQPRPWSTIIHIIYHNARIDLLLRNYRSATPATTKELIPLEGTFSKYCILFIISRSS
jgi:hypothetical protein